MVFAGDGVEFPVTETRVLLHNGWPSLDADAVRKLTPSLSGTIAFFTLLLTAQVSVQVTPGLLVRRDVLVNPFVVDCGVTVSLQPIRDLFVAPIQSEPRLDQVPRPGPDSCMGLLPMSLSG